MKKNCKRSQTSHSRRLGQAWLTALAATLFSGVATAFTVDASDLANELKDYRTVQSAMKATIRETKAVTAQTGTLGLVVRVDSKGIWIDQLVANGPAQNAGAAVGDRVVSVNGRKPSTKAELAEIIGALEPKSNATLIVNRGGKDRRLTAEVGLLSKPFVIKDERAVLGLQLAETTAEGTPIRRVTPNSPASKAGLESGDVVVRVDGVRLDDPLRLDSILQEKSGGDTLSIAYLRAGKEQETKATLETAPVQQNAQTFVPRNIWKKDVYRLAVIGIDYEDVTHNPKITAQAWSDALFSKGTYTGESVTGQKVFGSMNDHFIEQSNGAFRIEGKVFDWVKVGKKRMDYSEGTGTSSRSRGTLFGDALDAVLARDGANALDGFDGVFFIYAGNRVNTVRGGLYWPHRSTYRHKGKAWPYFLVQEGGERMTNISVLCHEFGHMIGLPDLYARPENPGSEGLGTWCLMSNQVGNGRPQHMSAWCKEQMGWLKPTVIDPSVPQKLILGPVNGSSTECFKVLVRPDGKEYFLLENRRKVGFDASLPQEGLLIWHVTGDKPQLLESHGVDGPAGPSAFLTAVPFPSVANNAFTPFTTPSSRSKLGGGLPVHITNIQQLPDGRVTFWIGYEIL